MTQEEINSWQMEKSSLADKLVLKALKSTTNAKEHKITNREIDGSGLTSTFRYSIYTEFLKVGGEYDNDSNDDELYDFMVHQVKETLSKEEDIEFSFDSGEKGYWGIDISYIQSKTEDIEEDIAEEFITLKTKQDLLKTLEYIIGYFDKWKFFQSWKCPNDKQKQIALIMMNSFRKKFVWDGKNYDIEFKVVITDKDTPEPKLMVFKTTLINNMKLNITALKELWDTVANKKQKITKKSFYNIYNNVVEKLKTSSEEFTKGDFLKPEVLRFDIKIGAIINNETNNENIVSIKIDYWNLFKDIKKFDDKVIRTIADKLLENLSFGK